jgi:hypothetical protein
MSAREGGTTMSVEINTHLTTDRTVLGVSR